jgi:hypothetical protein
MTKATEKLNVRNQRLTHINAWILKEGYQIISHHENNLTILGLYKPAPTKHDIPEFLKDLIRGNNHDVNVFVDGMFYALNLVD